MGGQEEVGGRAGGGEWPGELGDGGGAMRGASGREETEGPSGDPSA